MHGRLPGAVLRETFFFTRKAKMNCYFAMGGKKNVWFVMGDKRIAGMCIYFKFTVHQRSAVKGLATIIHLVSP